MNDNITRRRFRAFFTTEVHLSQSHDRNTALKTVQAMIIYRRLATGALGLPLLRPERMPEPGAAAAVIATAAGPSHAVPARSEITRLIGRRREMRVGGQPVPGCWAASIDP